MDQRAPSQERLFATRLLHQFPIDHDQYDVIERKRTALSEANFNPGQEPGEPSQP